MSSTFRSDAGTTLFAILGLTVRARALRDGISGKRRFCRDVVHSISMFNYSPVSVLERSGALNYRRLHRSSRCARLGKRISAI